MQVEIILYVKDQLKSKLFYENFLGFSPFLDVPGMTSFQLNEHTRLGLMPENGIAKIISPPMPHPENGSSIPRCELYIEVENLEKSCEILLNAQAKLISPIEMRSWGEKVAYFADLDSHVIAVWSKNKSMD